MQGGKKLYHPKKFFMIQLNTKDYKLIYCSDFTYSAGGILKLLCPPTAYSCMRECLLLCCKSKSTVVPQTQTGAKSVRGPGIHWALLYFTDRARFLLTLISKPGGGGGINSD